MSQYRNDRPKEQRPSVAYSQNFLRSRGLVRELVGLTSLGPDDLVVEIGPGEGIITRELAERCREVIAVEKDPELAERLARRFRDLPSVTVQEADFLEYRLPQAPYKVFANVPFRATSQIVSKLTSSRAPPEAAWLVLQREAAEKFAGEPSQTLAALLLAPWFEVSIVHRFRRTDFWPVPAVDVVLARFARRSEPLIREDRAQPYRDFVVYAFTAWKPSLGDALRPLFTTRQLRVIQQRLGIALGRRPSEVSFPEWLEIFESFSAHAGPAARARVEGSERKLRRQQARIEKVHRSRTSARR